MKALVFERLEYLIAHTRASLVIIGKIKPQPIPLRVQGREWPAGAVFTYLGGKKTSAGFETLDFRGPNAVHLCRHFRKPPLSLTSKTIPVPQSRDYRSRQQPDTMKSNTYRQGDVLIQQVAQIPKAAVKQKPRGRIILAHGEATGHHHSVDIDRADWWKQPNGEQFLDVKSGGAAVEHQEHDTIDLPPGKYRVRRQREYSPEAIRNVQD